MVLEAPHIAANTLFKMIERGIERLMSIRSRATGLHESSRTQMYGAIRTEFRSFSHECHARLSITIEVFSYRRREPLTNALRQGLANFDLLSSNTNLHHVSVRTSGFKPPAKLARPKKGRNIGRAPIPVNRRLRPADGRFQLAQAAPLNGRRYTQCFTIFCDRPARYIDAFTA